MITPTYVIPAWLLGLDLGQRRDFSALATLEIIWTFTGRDAVTFENVFEPTLNICGLRRFPLGTNYSAYPGFVERRIKQIRTKSGSAPIALIVDAGGPGGPVVDELRRAKLGVPITPMMITGGDHPGSAADGFKTVPRRELISNLVLLLEHNVLRWPEKLPMRATLEQELLQLSAKTTHPDHAGDHDDLVMAVAIAAWKAVINSPQLKPKPKNEGSKRWTPHERLIWW